MDLARSLVTVGQDTIKGDTLGISRESRGLAMVVLFAAYEKLLHSLAREILETAATYRGHRIRLAPGLRMLSISNALSSVQNSTDKNLWTNCAPRLTQDLLAPASLMNTNIFPNDGSFMDASQVAVFCDVFAFPRWKQELGRALPLLSGIRNDRNAVAHGRLTAEEVGRDKTYQEALSTIDHWEEGWYRFLDMVENLTSQRSYFVPA